MNSMPVNLAAARLDLLPESELFDSRSSFSVLRLDLLHPEISGNKWYKLAGYLELAVQSGKTSLVSFGGPWSNHLVALAVAGQAFGLETTGIVRGEAPAVFSPALLRMRETGMRLRFTDRQMYDRLQKPESSEILRREYPDAVIIPEGGRGQTGRTGAARIAQMEGVGHFTHLCMAVGTGTTIAGMALGSSEGQELTGIPVLKGTQGYEPIPAEWMKDNPGSNRIKLLHGFDHGGYAKHSPALLQFMNRFHDRFNIPSDFVYTGKLFFAIARLSSEDFFVPGSRVLMIHTGGLQGNRSLPAHSLDF